MQNSNLKIVQVIPTICDYYVIKVLDEDTDEIHVVSAVPVMQNGRRIHRAVDLMTHDFNGVELDEPASYD